MKQDTTAVLYNLDDAFIHTSYTSVTMTLNLNTVLCCLTTRTNSVIMPPAG